MDWIKQPFSCRWPAGRALYLTIWTVLMLTGPLAARSQSDEAALDAAERTATQNNAASIESGDSDVGEPTAAIPPTRFETQIEFERLVAEGQYGEAVAVGQTMLDLTIAESGELSTEAAVAHQALAEAQRQAQLFDDAELNYLRAIEIFRDIDGPFARSTIAPTIGLGDNYHDDRQYQNAVSAYDEARTVQRRVDGLLSENQIVLLDRLTRSFQAMQMHLEADEQQLAALALIERNHPAGSIEVLEGIYKYARWLRTVARFFDERAQYDRAIRMIRGEYDKNHPLLVTPYREIGNSFRSQAFGDPRGASSLNSALEILQELGNPDPLQLAETLVDIGDWKTAFNPVGGGQNEYLGAWELAGTLPDGDSLRQQWFSLRRPVVVLLENMSIRGISGDPLDSDAIEGRVLVQFDVDPTGRPENVAIVESEPPGFKDAAAARAIRQSRFRPRIENGEFVYARGRGFLFTFRYVPDEVD